MLLQRWTPDQVDFLINSINSGEKIKYRILAEKFNKPVNAICGQVKRLRDKGILNSVTPRIHVRKNPKISVEKPLTPTPPPPPPPPKIVPIEPITVGLATIISVQDMQCRFVLNDPKHSLYVCGCPVNKPKSSWCEKHAQLIWPLRK